MSEVRDPQAEATDLLPAGHVARILEPSPPANTDPQWYADDPTDPGGTHETIVTPIPGEGVSWDEIVARHPDVGGFAADHWLGNHRRLETLPDGFASTRQSLHQIAFFAVAPKRYAETAKLGLRYTHRGYGTPFFGSDSQVRVEGSELLYQRQEEVSAATVSTVSEACDFLDIPYRETWFDDFHDPLKPAGPDAQLDIDPKAAESIGDWFGFATLVLERLRRTPGAVDVSRVQLWPEHFDPAVELGSAEHGHRASFGASVGDDAHPEPYLYVAAWGDIDRGDRYWNDTSFNGASISYSELLDSDDQIEAALAFLRSGRERLTSR